MTETFSYGKLCGDVDIFAVNKSKYSSAEADKLFLRETGVPLENTSVRATGWVNFDVGFNTVYDSIVGFWFSKIKVGENPQEVYVYVY